MSKTIQRKISRRPRREHLQTQLERDLRIILPDNVEDEAKIVKTEFFTTSRNKLIIYWILGILTVGIIPLLCLWRFPIRMFFKYVRSTPQDAKSVLIHGYDGTIEHIRMSQKALYFGEVAKMYKIFEYRFYTFFFDDIDDYYKPCLFNLQGYSYKNIHREIGNGMSSWKQYEERYTTYGKNSTTIPPVSNIKILLDEVLSLLNLSQLYSIIIWSIGGYYVAYAAFIFALSVITIIFNFIKAKNNHNKIRQKSYYQTEVRVYRPCQEEGGITTQVPFVISSTNLVPGDLIEIPCGKKMPCDVILLSGTCIMNESMLTGEAMLVTKHALPQSDKKFDFWAATQHILFAGTECVDIIKAGCEPQVVGVVVRTGFWTAKARLLRSYLYLKPEGYLVLKDTLKYIGCIALIAFICFACSLKMFMENSEDNLIIIQRFFDIITVAIPPVMPTCVLIVTFVASFRLERDKILTKSELKINLAGKVDMVCFDKTGTLTKGYFDLHGVQPVSTSEHGFNSFTEIINDDIHENLLQADAGESYRLLLEHMATCHNITFVKKIISGDPFDIKIFKAIDWRLNFEKEDRTKLCTIKPPKSQGRKDDCYAQKLKIDIIQRFDYNIKLQRMSVIVKNSLEEYQRMNMKGTPAAVKELCLPLTMPFDYDEVVQKYERSGYKVFACATKVLKHRVKASDNLLREYFERDFDFLGFLVFENKLNEETPIIINKLTEADIPSIMLTEDSPSDSVFLAFKAGILKENQKVVLGNLSSMGLGLSAGTVLKKLEWSWLDVKGNKNKDFEEEAEAPLNILTTEQNDMNEVPLNILTTEQNEFNDDIQLEAIRIDSSREDIDPTSPKSLDILTSIKTDKNIAIVITGQALRFLSSISSTDPVLHAKLLEKTQVYADMLPDDKAMVIREYQKHGRIVAMCGDGTNDCSALKAASIGIAISEGEASLAANFMSKINNISCVDRLLREGRASLSTTFQVFKYLSMYALIQTFTILILYLNRTELMIPCYVFQDVFITLPAAITISFARPADKLSKRQPDTQLMSIPVMASVLGQSIIQTLAQVLAIDVLQQQPWYVSSVDLAKGENEILVEGIKDSDMGIPDYDSSVLFLVSNVQLLTMVIAFSKGYPFRQPLYKNWALLFVVTASAIINLILIVTSVPSILDLLKMKDFGSGEFRGILFGIVAGNTILTLLYERYALAWVVKILKKITCTKEKKQ